MRWYKILGTGRSRPTDGLLIQLKRCRNKPELETNNLVRVCDSGDVIRLSIISIKRVFKGGGPKVSRHRKTSLKIGKKPLFF